MNEHRADEYSVQVNAIESANMNKETLEAMKKGAEVLKGIHGKLYARFSTQSHPIRRGLTSRPFRVYSNVDKVDATMDEVRNQLELTNEISQAISDPAGMGIDVRGHLFSCLLHKETDMGHLNHCRSTIKNWQTNWQNWNKTNSTNVWQEPNRHRFTLLQLLYLPVSSYLL